MIEAHKPCPDCLEAWHARPCQHTHPRCCSPRFLPLPNTTHECIPHTHSHRPTLKPQPNTPPPPQGEPEFERLKRELDEVKHAPRGMDGAYRSAAEMDRHRHQLEVQTAFREQGARLQAAYDKKQNAEYAMAKRCVVGGRCGVVVCCVVVVVWGGGEGGQQRRGVAGQKGMKGAGKEPVSW